MDGTGRFAQETYSAVQPSHMNPAQMVVEMVVKKPARTMASLRVFDQTYFVIVDFAPTP
jgi:hypothetical protein